MLLLFCLLLVASSHAERVWSYCQRCPRQAFGPPCPTSRVLAFSSEEVRILGEQP